MIFKFILFTATSKSKLGLPELLSHAPVNAFFPPVEDPAGITFNTLNLTLFNPTLFQKRFPPFPGLFPLLLFLELRNTLGCLRKAFSVCSAIFELCGDWLQPAQLREFVSAGNLIFCFVRFRKIGFFFFLLFQ